MNRTNHAAHDNQLASIYRQHLGSYNVRVTVFWHFLSDSVHW